MASFLLDTNHASPLVTLAHPLRSRVLANVASGNNFSIALPSLTELLYGISLLPRASQNLKIWESLQDAITLLNIERNDAEFAARIQIQARKRGRQVGTVDALIAAISLRDDLTLLTTDRDFEAIPALKTENWLS
jgi:tRNA(fMet)-specific endonuclease VapC